MLLLLNSTKEQLILTVLLCVMNIDSTLNSCLVDTEVSEVIVVAISLANALIVITLVLHMLILWGLLVLLVFLLLNLKR